VGSRRTFQRDHPDLGEMRLHLHDDGFVIEPAAPNPAGLMALTLRDDLGTAYRIWGDHGDGTKFVPAIPPEASWLQVFGPSGSVRFDFNVM
jgi:hypothetical protein